MDSSLPRRPSLETGPMSPCVSICTLDERGLCRGCFRTLEEISGWLRMSGEERWTVLRATDARRAASQSNARAK